MERLEGMAMVETVEKFMKQWKKIAEWLPENEEGARRRQWKWQYREEAKREKESNRGVSEQKIKEGEKEGIGIENRERMIEMLDWAEGKVPKKERVKPSWRVVRRNGKTKGRGGGSQTEIQTK